MASEEHRWLGYADARPGRFIAVCSCGWRSPAMPTAGLAAAASDAHRARVRQAEDDGEQTDGEDGA